MNLRVVFLAIGISMLGLVACSGEESIRLSSDATFGIRHDRVLADYEALVDRLDPALPDFTAVVSFDYSLDGSAEKDFTATGILIAEDWVLTAAHNFYDAEEQAAPAPASGISVNVGNNPNQPLATYEVLEVVYHPSWLAGNQAYTDANDLCLCRLSQAVSEVTPAVLHLDEQEALGSVAWHCGFGDYSQLEGQNPDLISRKHATQNILDRVQGGFRSEADGMTYTGGLLAFDFDHPDGSINALGDEFISSDERDLGDGASLASALEFEGTTVEGDSGGPLFVLHNDRWEVAGILSGGASEPIPNHADGDYGDISIYIRVASAQAWIRTVIP